MYGALIEYVKKAAYLQWEKTGSGSALEHWRCVEDIVCFLEGSNIVAEDDLLATLKAGGSELGYETLVREIAYRISFFSGSKDAERNWFLAEQLLHNSEWRRAVMLAAEIFRTKKSDPEFLNMLRSEKVRDHYSNSTFDRDRYY